MSINPLNDISKVYLEQVSVASRVKNAVADDRLDAEQEKTNASMNKLRQQNKRFDRASASDAARKVERDVKKSSAYGPQRPKPGTTKDLSQIRLLDNRACHPLYSHCGHV